jgi:hypothetical protein
MKDHRARPCPMCSIDAEPINVISVYTRPRFMAHVREEHPGLDPSTLWVFPLPNRKGAA